MVTTLALATSAAFVISTSYFHRTSEALAAEVEGVRLAEEAEIDLLLHGQAQEPALRQSLEREIAARLREARRQGATERELALIGLAEARFDEYVLAVRAGGP